MILTIPKEKPKPKTFEFCEREDISIKEVVEQREELRKELKREGWAPHRMEIFERRWKWLTNRLADDHPKTKEYLKQ